MGIYEKLIAEVEKSDKYPRPADMEDGIHTIGTFIKAVFMVGNEKDAREFIEGEIAYILKNSTDPMLHQEDPKMNRLEAIKIARSNIGWCFGEGMDKEKIAMWIKATQSSHPVFGTRIPTSDQAFNAGKKIGKAIRGNK
jgi:hypothetical protein